MTFRASIQTFKRSTYSVELRGNALVYYEAVATNKAQIKIIPTVEQWQAFRKEVDNLGIWEWRGNYDNLDAWDGTSWTVLLSYPDRGIRAHGGNCFPDQNGMPSRQPEPTKHFKRYLAAVQTLLGGKNFK